MIKKRATAWLSTCPSSESDAGEPPAIAAGGVSPPDERDGWSVAMVYRGRPPFTRGRVYDVRPTRRDLDRFARENFWPFAAHEGDRLLDAEVCAESFAAAFGQPPWRRYPPPIPNPKPPTSPVTTN